MFKKVSILLTTSILLSCAAPAFFQKTVIRRNLDEPVNKLQNDLFPILTQGPDHSHDHEGNAHSHGLGGDDHSHPEGIHEHEHTHENVGISHFHVHNHSMGEHSDHTHEFDWKHCADEYGDCECNGIVRFGFNGTYANFYVVLPRKMEADANETYSVACNMKSFDMHRACNHLDEANFPYETKKVCECKGTVNPKSTVSVKIVEEKMFPDWAAVLVVITLIVLFCAYSSRVGLRKKHGLVFEDPQAAERRASLVIMNQETEVRC